MIWKRLLMNVPSGNVHPFQTCREHGGVPDAITTMFTPAQALITFLLWPKRARFLPLSLYVLRGQSFTSVATTSDFLC